MNFYNSVRHKFLGIRLKISIPLFLALKKKDIKGIILNNKKLEPLSDLIKCDNKYELNLLLNARVNNKVKPLKRLIRDIDKHKGKDMRYFNGSLCIAFNLPSLGIMMKHAERDYQNKVLQVHSYEKLSPRSRRIYLKQKRRKYLKYKIAKKKGGK